MEGQLRDLIREAIDAARTSGDLDAPGQADFDVMKPPRPEHGDWSTNAAMVLQKSAGRNPREIAETLIRHLPERPWILKAEVAGPGFVNLFLSDDWLHDVCRRILRAGERFGASEEGAGEQVDVEFVSINPTGPLHVAHGRHAAVGDAVAQLLEFTGHGVTREYYFNDAGGQMERFGASVAARYLELSGRDVRFPEDGYHGTYVIDLARQVLEEDGDVHTETSLEELGPRMRDRTYPIVLGWIEETLDRFGVHFDVWFKERELYDSGAVEAVLDRLREAGHLYEQDGATWLRTSVFGDAEDRVVIKSDGGFTYRTGDFAYHVDKLRRGFDRMLVLLGADHHGHVQTLLAGMRALGEEDDRIEPLLMQKVHLSRSGEAVPMSKRTGSMVALDELIEEVGADAARYTFLQSSIDHDVNFDIDEVKQRSLENPVYYVQYAHARIASILRRSSEEGIAASDQPDWTLLDHDAELELMRGLSEFEGVVGLATRERAPYRLAKYVEDLARRFHRFYTECRVITEDGALTGARLALARATQQVVANALGLLGVSAPDRMEWEEDA